MIPAFITRNLSYVVRNPRKAWSTIKAMRAYAKTHPVCEITGTKPIEVHHVRPINVAPELAADPSNFISLGARTIHFIFGHGGDNWKDYVTNVRDIQVPLFIVRNTERYSK